MPPTDMNAPHTTSRGRTSPEFTTAWLRRKTTANDGGFTSLFRQVRLLSGGSGATTEDSGQTMPKSLDFALLP
jgi:hypothetical protein